MTEQEDTISAIAAGYAFTGPALDLGAVVVEGVAHPKAQVRIPLAVLNRHGLVAGATGTGKTKTLQLIAEQLSAQGVPVFLADIKGDVSGVSAPGRPGDRVAARAAEVGQDWRPAGCPAEFYALGGIGTGIPVRATVTDFGPTLLAKVLDLNETQESSLGLIFHFADRRGLELVDLKDLRAVIQYLTDDQGKAELKQIGGLSPATAGVILRALVTLENSGGGAFFGEPDFDTADLLRTTADGHGMVSILELAAVQDKKGAPTPVAWTRLRAPLSLMAPIEPEAMRAAVTGSPLFAKYGTAVDRESAFEKLTAAQAPPAEPAAAAPEPESAPGREKAGQAERAGKAGKSRSVVEQVMGNSAVKSMLRSVGGQIGREITRGLFGTARRKR